MGSKEWTTLYRSIPYDARRMFYEIRFWRCAETWRTEQKEREEVHTSYFLKNLRTPWDWGVWRAGKYSDVYENSWRGADGRWFPSVSYLWGDDEARIILWQSAFDLPYGTFVRGNARDISSQTGEKNMRVETHALSERIISQMLIFPEMLFFGGSDFQDYYERKSTYFRLKQAYLAYVAGICVVHDRWWQDKMYLQLLKEYQEKEYLADICKVAVMLNFMPTDFLIIYGNIWEILREFWERDIEKRLSIFVLSVVSGKLASGGAVVW